MIKVANRLRPRVGASKHDEDGFIDPQLIEEADKLISALCVDCPKTISGHLDALTLLWEKMKSATTVDERYNTSVQIFTLAHEIKDVSAMCQYALLSHFAESLRDYIGQTELNIHAQVVIIQAHIDAMQIVHKQGVKSDAGPEAEELRKMVARAVEQYQ